MRPDLGLDSPLERLRQDLTDLGNRYLDRHLEAMDPTADTCFCSNDYLGLATHPDLVRAVRASIARLGRVASTGSRLMSGHSTEWEELEQQFADYAGEEAALYFGSGYAANIGLLTSVLRAEDTIYSDAANHASLIDGIRLARCRKVIFPHLDLGFLEDALRRDADREGDRFILVESVYSMDGDSAPLEALGVLSRRYGAEIIVDAAHATGVRGPQGRAIQPGWVFAGIHPCGKALASAGAFVTGSRTLIEWLINRARTFIFTTAPPPYMAAQLHTAIRLVAGADPERARLIDRSRILRQRLAAFGFDTGASDSQIVPVILGSSTEALEAANALEAAGFSVRAIRPPTVPDDAARLRLSVRADTPESAIHDLVDSLTRWRDARR
jgi:8-amino-7-oxononanoate synthase